MRQQIDENVRPLQAAAPFKPEIIYASKASEELARLVNASIDGANGTLHNASTRVASAAAALLSTTSPPLLSISTPSGSSSASRDHLVMTETTTTSLLKGGIDTVDTKSLSEHVSQLSLLHLLGWFLLFAAITVLTVVLLNWCLHSQNDAANDGDDEEMCGKSAVSSSALAQGTHTEGLSSATSSSSRLLPSRGNLARQQFLESRKTGIAVKSYGGTASTSPVM
ncbi:hypothetical protein LSCM1_03060 [Leishmania martiniquensis]|uniref:Uncharacterized protein n=1 Tax=Leishmania martiniquensis TaxID=1580590 RepID=A0A836HCC6_9TRYP|nr:hypothetical protein LSCM1_03060 [Leishmania martiniquensis]